METASDRRLRKLRELCETNGGPRAVGKKAGVSGDSLDQILKGVLLPERKDGSRAPRTLGDPTARKIEAAFGKPRGWFDAEDAPAGEQTLPFRDLDPFEVQLVTYFRQMPADERHLLLVALHSRSAPGPAPSSPESWAGRERRIEDRRSNVLDRRAPKVFRR